MTRDEMLKILKDLPYVIVWPDSSWNDISGTERELWVNSEGYGYFMCGEPNPTYWKGNGFDESKWNNIKLKIEEKNLTFDDIIGTPLEQLLNTLYSDYITSNDKNTLNNDLQGLLKLKNGACGYFYAVPDYNGPLFFDNEEDFKKEYERDWAENLWKDMNDESLKTWITRLIDENNPDLNDWIIRNKLTGADRT